MPEVAVKKAAPVTRIEAPKVIEKPITPKPRVVPVAKPVEPKAIAKPKVIPATKKAKTAKLPPKLESTQRLLLFQFLGLKTLITKTSKLSREDRQIIQRSDSMFCSRRSLSMLKESASNAEEGLTALECS